ncbi:MAG: hypothetical protein ABSF22_19660 [Bryobacteraceae bacterium]|jgi:hypothetical protein
MLLRRMLPYTTAAVLIAFLYAGWTIYSRLTANRRADEEAAARKLAFDQKTLNMIGSDLKITQFYANYGGAKTLVCYGVANAKSVRIEPAIEEITPSLGRCIEASPPKTTEYTLTAEDGAGHSVTQTIVVKVH